MKLSRLAVLVALISAPAMAADAVKLRLGWQVPWATQGQLVQILKHTDILKKHGLEAEFIGKTFGPQLNELALAGQLDALFTGDQPGITLFSKDKGWKGVGRLMYNRTATYVPVKSPIQTIKDLKGKTIAIPIGAAAERVTLEALQREGLDPKTDVKIVNLDIKEQGPLVTKDKDATKWGDFDAMSGFDPTPAMFEARGLVRTLDVGKVVSLVIMSEEFMKKNPGAAEKMMAAMVDAYDYYRQNRAQADQWFMEEAKMDKADAKALDIAASLEPNLAAKSRDEIRVSFNEDDYARMQKVSEFLAPKLGKSVAIATYVSDAYAPKPAKAETPVKKAKKKAGQTKADK